MSTELVGRAGREDRELGDRRGVARGDLVDKYAPVRRRRPDQGDASDLDRRPPPRGPRPTASSARDRRDRPRAGAAPRPRHALARRLFFANQGAFRVGDRDEIMNKVTALSVPLNAVLVWNSVKFAEVVAGLEATTGDTVAGEDLARVSPLASAHVIPSGTYRFPKAARALE